MAGFGRRRRPENDRPRISYPNRPGKSNERAPPAEPIDTDGHGRTRTSAPPAARVRGRPWPSPTLSFCNAPPLGFVSSYTRGSSTKQDFQDSTDTDHFKMQCPTKPRQTAPSATRRRPLLVIQRVPYAIRRTGPVGICPCLAENQQPKRAPPASGGNPPAHPPRCPIPISVPASGG